MSLLAWGSKVSPTFRGGVRRIAEDIGFDPSWLMAYMAFETGETFSPSIKNPQSKATGLIQFLPSTAIGLGTTVEKLAAMPAEKQLFYVYEYFKPFKDRIKTFADGYMAIFWPAAVGKADDYTIITDATSKAYVQNKGLDLNKDGNITKAEAASFPLARLDKGLQPDLATIEDREPRPGVTMSESRPSIVDGIGAVATMLNPIAGIVFNAFSPLIKEKIAKEVDRHSDTPGVGAAVADALNTAILDKAKEVTGRTDDLEAAAVVVQPQNVVKLQTVESTAVSSVDELLTKLAPLLDKSAEYDKAKWQAEQEGKDAASLRAIAEKKAGVYDFTRVLVWFAAITSTLMTLALTGAIIYQAIFASDINTALIGLAGPLLAIAMGVWREVFAYRFDGNKETSAQTQAVLNLSEVASKKG